jgi:Na+/H+ antiporter NhaD/arsenite permease-like protein
MIAFSILVVLFLLIALRSVFHLPLPIWGLMLIAAGLMLATLQISPPAALAAIDWQVILFLAGMFVIGEGLRQSGLLAAFVQGFVLRFPRPGGALFVFMLLAGLLSALVTNDTIAVIGTPVALLLAGRYRLPARLPLLGLALAVTLGSAFSPIGNPQNLLVALAPALKAPFTDFAWWLALPSLLSLAAGWGALRLLFWRDFRPAGGMAGSAVSVAASSDPAGAHHPASAHLEPPHVPDHPHTHGPLVRLSLASLGLVVALILLRSVWNLLRLPGELPLWLISVVAALPLLLLSPHRFKLLKGMDWQTLVFFAALFVTVRAVWDQGVIQQGIALFKLDLAAPVPLFLACLAASQLVSNVPLVALFLPVLASLGAPLQSYLVLAAGSTIAGNLTILGAASNVIILQQAEREAGREASFSFMDMLRVGLPLTLVSAGLYLGWWRLIG